MLAFLKWPERLSPSRALALVEPSRALGWARSEPRLMLLEGPCDDDIVNDDLPLLSAPGAEDRPVMMSPRDMADWAHELYMAGALTWDEYRQVGFPSELHPEFDRTIGALTGERAEPDRPRDMLAEWKSRAAFERRYNGDAAQATQRADRIVALLRSGWRPSRQQSA